MRRWALHIPAALSLSIGTAFVILWIRSFLVSDWYSNASVSIGVNRGTILVGRYQSLGLEPPPIEQRFREESSFLDESELSSDPGLRRDLHLAGFVWRTSSGGVFRQGWPMNGSYETFFPGWTIGVPLWFLTLLCLVLPARWWVLRRRGLAIPSNHCASCGYDLRATPQRCPECGREPASAEGRL